TERRRRKGGTTKDTKYTKKERKERSAAAYRSLFALHRLIVSCLSWFPSSSLLRVLRASVVRFLSPRLSVVVLEEAEMSHPFWISGVKLNRFNDFRLLTASLPDGYATNNSLRRRA